MVDRERRQHLRATLATNVVLTRNRERVGSFGIINLSAGGILAAGEPQVRVGERLEAVLHVSPEAEVRAEAVLTRTSRTRRGATFALSFTRISADAEDAIQDAVLAALEETAGASVLIVDDSTEICSALRMQLRRLGHRAFAVGTPLEAVHFLQQPNSISVALVDLVLGTSNGLDVLAYLADQHPKVRRVLMSGRALPSQLELARQTAFPFSAHEVLPKPWTESALTRAVGP
jgi:CheY-like chemotaxis protein